MRFKIYLAEYTRSSKSRKQLTCPLTSYGQISADSYEDAALRGYQLLNKKLGYKYYRSLIVRPNGGSNGYYEVIEGRVMHYWNYSIKN